MKIKSVDHVTIIVRDLEKTLWFYGKLLGFKQLQTVDLEDHILRYFQLPGGVKLELNEYLYPTRDSVSQLKDRGTYRHLAFEVDDVFEVEKVLTREGYPFHFPVSHSPELGVTGGLVKDPNGVEIEFIEYDKTGSYISI